MTQPLINVIGAGLAGVEAAWAAAARGCRVRLYEMRPLKSTPAHHSDKFAELVCSNSLKSDALDNACGLLKAEMRLLGSLTMQAAAATSVPAGGALAVDREAFSAYVTQAIRSHSDIEVVCAELSDINSLTEATVIASGPLTSPALSNSIAELCGAQFMYFYDAAAPIIERASIDMNVAYCASRYDKGTADYINLPFDEKQYELFYQELLSAQRAPLRDFEDLKLFEGCMPIEEMARRGVDTMRYGPLKPVGLINPHTGQLPYAVVQLRQDDFAAALYNMVGFQTNLKWPEQQRVFSLIPGLRNVEIVRYGVMHRNTFIESPRLLERTQQLTKHCNIFFAGQITGMEGYVESAASGILSGINCARLANGQALVEMPQVTMLGALTAYITTPAKHFQPMNANFGIVPNADRKIRNKKERYAWYAERSLNAMRHIIDEQQLS